MTRTWYGTGGEGVIAEIATDDGDFQPTTATYDAYTAQVGGTRHTDLLDRSNGAITQVGPHPTDKRIIFQGLDGYLGTYWLQDTSDPTAPRYSVPPSNLYEILTGTTGIVTTAQMNAAIQAAFVDPTDKYLLADWSHPAYTVTATPVATTYATVGNGTNGTLYFPVVANQAMRFVYLLFVETSAVAGIKLRLGLPNTADGATRLSALGESGSASFYATTGNTTANNLTFSGTHAFAALGVGNQTCIKIEGFVRSGTTGNCVLSAAQNAADPTSFKVLGGSNVFASPTTMAGV